MPLQANNIADSLSPHRQLGGAAHNFCQVSAAQAGRPRHHLLDIQPGGQRHPPQPSAQDGQSRRLGRQRHLLKTTGVWLPQCR